MVKSPFLSLSGCDHRGLMAQGGKSLLAGAKRTGQVGKLGATFRGNRFSDCADWLGLQCANQKGRPVWVRKRILKETRLVGQFEFWQGAVLFSS